MLSRCICLRDKGEGISGNPEEKLRRIFLIKKGLGYSKSLFWFVRTG
jgi:hypothetical protein